MLDRRELIFTSILELINETNEFLFEVKTYKNFNNSKITRKACKANFIDIAQGLKDLKEKHSFELKFEDRKVIKLRNMLTHQYWKNNDYTMWELIKNYFPILEERIELEIEALK